MLICSVITWYEIPVNATVERLVTGTCGRHFCPGDNILTNPNFRRPDEGTILLMVYIFVGSVAVSVILVSVGVDSLSR
jgi:hypothetical protein